MEWTKLPKCVDWTTFAPTAVKGLMPPVTFRVMRYYRQNHSYSASLHVHSYFCIDTVRLIRSLICSHTCRTSPDCRPPRQCASRRASSAARSTTQTAGQSTKSSSQTLGASRSMCDFQSSLSAVDKTNDLALIAIHSSLAIANRRLQLQLPTKQHIDA